MMFLLRGYVAPNFVQSGVTDREGSVSGLPGEPPSIWKLLMYPAGGISFHNPQQVGDRLGRGNREEQMNVIRRTIDYQWNALTLFDYTAHIGEEPAGQFG
jgi:hypothetical protein